MHNGDDTAFYLAKGFRVVSLEANPALVEAGRKRFEVAIADGRLTIVQKAIASEPGEVSFFINPRAPGWSSIYKNIAGRDGKEIEEIRAPAVSITDLMQEHGVPYYAKIDIELADRDALLQMGRSDMRPRYVSAEAHDISYLTYLKDMGYKRFKVVNQANYWWFNSPVPPKEGKEVPGWKFTIHSSGPFGEESPGKWTDFESAAYLYLQMKRISSENEFLLKQWMDFHATT